MTAENYHLKWDSHLSYLNSSVATLYKNEKFADVVLYSSSSSSCGNGNGSDSGIPTVGISAHKFILSSCSQFFATMFETAPITSPNGVLYVVLPPDLSHRAIQILVQYMYSGEATVANDILNEVLRGGEILKIRGLCRTSSSASGSQNLPTRGESLIMNGGGSHFVQNLPNRQPTVPSISHSHAHIPSAHANDMFVINKCHASSNGNCGTRYPIENLQQQQPSIQSTQTTQHAHQLQPIHNQFRGLGASVLPKDTPVIVKSTKPSQLGLLSVAAAAVATSSSSSSRKQQMVGGSISVNKDVAIDPDEKCCYQLNHLPVATSLCNDMGCSGGCPITMEDDHTLRRGQRNQNNETIRANVVEQHLEREYSDRPRSPPDEQDERDDIDLPPNYDRHTHLRRGSAGDRIRDYFLPETYEHTNATCTKTHKPFSDRINERLNNNTTPPPMSHSQNFPPIKQEPTDWASPTSATDNLAGRSKSPQRSPKQPLDFKMLTGGTTVKLEVGSHSRSPHIDQDTNTQESRDYEAHLACETCQQSFDEPKLWVRHLESHTNNSTTTTTTAAAPTATDATINIIDGNTTNNEGDTNVKAYVPKKRRRVSQQENSAGHVTLCCDLCSISFDTPADWVRHINNEHTEIELAMFNSKKDNEQKSTSNNNNNNPNLQHSHSKRYTHRPTYDTQNANETQTEANSNGTGAATTSTFSDQRSDACGVKKFSTHNVALTHKRNHNALNGISVSVSTNVASSSSQRSSADMSLIGNATNSLPNEQITTSSKA